MNDENLQVNQVNQDNFDLGFSEDTPIEAETENQETMENVDNVEETVDNAEPTEAQQEIQEEVQKIKLKYNKQELELPIDEVQVLAQKGMNYDKVIERLNQAENNPALQYLDDLAQRNGTNVDDLINFWKEQERQAELNQLIQANIPQELASEILENRKYREQQQAIQRENEVKQRQELEFKDFFDSFPNVSPESIPAEVWEKNSNGTPLKYAYMEYEMDKIKNENNILKNNNANKKKAVVNPIGNSNVEETEDMFLKGFNS